MDTEDFDWQTQTTLKGTCSRIGQYVRGACGWTAGCPETDALVYDSWDDETLLCATHTRIRSQANPRKETCDKCGSENAWRDPLTRKSEFFCAQCHASNGTVFQNRWANKARVSTPLSYRERPKCEAANHGTECSGEVKWRSGSFNMSLCNKHAGKKSSGPAGHQ